MSAARDIDVRGLSSTFQNALSLSISPTSTFHSPPSSFGPRAMAAHNTSSKQLKPFNTGDVRILLLENVNQTAQDMLKRQGYQVEFYKSSLPEDELIEKIWYVWHPTFFFQTPVKSAQPHQRQPLCALPHQHALMMV
jgi:D-3-phosphoglycerate dehydrogenase